MSRDGRRWLAVLCSELLLLNWNACGGRRTTLPSAAPAPEVFQPLQEDLKKSYLKLFEIAATLEYSDSQISTMRDYLAQAKDYCTGRFEVFSKDFERDTDEAQRALKQTGITNEQRHELHCKIQSSRALKSQADVIARHAIPVAYENKGAKLELIQKWPGQFRTIQQSVTDGSYKTRRWGDVEDIGFRQLEPRQKDDIKMGQDSIRELKLTGLMPKEMEEKAVVDYVKRVAQRVASNSDLLVPLQVTVLNSREINAFALPGGFVFVQRGILEAVEDESQLAGVLSHEMSHAVARHGRKLMKKATIASIFYQAAQVAAVIFTGGVAGIGTYYALQYGFYGLGLVLDLSLLGVSREFELEADQLGIQYASKAGYDPSGYIRFFDKMATTEGYVNSASWFRSHPPFYQRMVEAKREMTYLPEQPDRIVTTTEFKRMKEALAKISAAAAEDEAKDKPSLMTIEKGCPPLPKLIFEPDQPIESICAAPKLSKEH